MSTSAQKEDIVISGFSGKFPLSDNVNVFRENLFNGLDMVTTEQRYKFFHPDLPKRIGKVNDIEKFDAAFFGIHRKEADIMEPMYRGLIEKVVEAVYDAGVNLKELEGTKTGVYVTTVHSDCQFQMLKDDLKRECHAFTGLVRGVLANRISYSLKLNGPSFAVDTGCSSSLFALNEAFKDMKNGKIDAAIVGASVLNLDQMTTVHTARLGILGPDGVCKVFDDEANGYARSEAICVIFLQKYGNARRIYSHIVHSKVNCDGYKKEGIIFPSADGQRCLLRDFYTECQVSPNTVDFMEAHGTGTAVGDFEEIRPIDEIFCENRSTPLLLGSVKSNMGHAEAAAAFCQIAKAIITMETGFIPPNLHFKKPRRGVEGFEKQRIQVVTKITPFTTKSGLIALNSFGFGGANGHVLLKRNDKVKSDKSVLQDEIPYLICVSGRVRNGLEGIFDKILPLDVEFITLLHHLFKHDIPQNVYRGFAIFLKNKEIYRSIKCKCTGNSDFNLTFGGPNRKLAKQVGQLLVFPLGQKIIKEVQEILDKNEINGKTTQHPEFNIVLATVTIQIVISEILKTLNIVPKAISGTSYGNFVKMFVEGSLSLEETISNVYHAVNVKYNNDMSFMTKENNPSIIFKVPVENEIILIPQTEDNLIFSLLQVIGRLYECGCNPQLHEIYPKVTFPVSRETHMISPLIQWNHEENWFVPPFGEDGKQEGPCQTIVKIDLNEGEWNFITDYIIDDRNLFPASAYLYIVWKVFASMKKKSMEELKVVFEDIIFNRATHVRKDVEVEFSVNILKASGIFEILESSECVASGRIALKDDCEEECNNALNKKISENITLVEGDVYKELRLKGYDFRGLFRSIKLCDLSFCKAIVKWQQNWIAFIENMFQLQMLNVVYRNPFVPIYIQKVAINSSFHLQLTSQETMLPIYYYKELNTIKCGGIEIECLKTCAIPRKQYLNEPILEKYLFVSNKASLSIEESVRVNIQLIIENVFSKKIKFTEILENGRISLTPLILDTIDSHPGIQAEVIQKEKEVSDCLLVVACNLLQNKDQLDEVFEFVASDGFVLSRENCDSIINYECSSVLTLHTTPLETMVLLRKCRPYKALKTVSLESQNWLFQLQKFIRMEKEVLICSQNEPTSGVLGLINCIRREPNGTLCRCIFVQDKTTSSIDLNLEFYQKQLSKGMVVNVFKNGHWGTYRHLLLNKELVSEKQHAYVQSFSKGELFNLKWIEGPLAKIVPGYVDVYYGALNFAEVVTNSDRIQYYASNSFDQINLLPGLEYAGRDFNGRRVMGILPAGVLSTRVESDKGILLSIPNEWSFEEAVTVPVAYTAALYTLLKKANIKRGQTILICSGGSSVGQAAINIAFHYELEIFIAVETVEEQIFLLRHFPTVKKDFIGISRDINFYRMLLKETKGKGVDIILNSLTESKLQPLIRCLASNGTFLQLEKYNSSRRLPLNILKRGSIFCYINLEELFHSDFQNKKCLTNLLEAAIVAKAVKPLPRKIHDVSKTQEAFKLITSDRSFNKILIKLRNEGDLTTCKTVPAVERYYCIENGCYIVTGGLGGFGLELINWLIERGARKLVAVSRNGVKNGYQAFRIKVWKEQGVQLIISNVNISTKKGCEILLKEATSLGPVLSIFHLAADISDALFVNQTEDSFIKPFESKSEAATHLDVVSRSMCPHLKDFVLFSSFASGRGNPGQSNYGMTNSIMERICEKRKEINLPALAIQWAPIGDVGMVAEAQVEDTLLERLGTGQQKISSCLQVLDRFLKEKEVAVVCSMIVSRKKDTNKKTNNVVDSVANVLGLRDIKTISLHTILPELGMDSITVMEVKQIIEKELQTVLTVNDIMNLTFANLYEMQSAKSNRQEERI